MRPREAVLLATAVAISVVLSSALTLAWTGPQNAPPNCVSGQTGCDAPINVGPTAQFKNGNFGLWGNRLLAASGGSYLNFGATSGSTGYGIRDNSGTLEFKNTGGSWTNLTNTVTNVLGIGAVSQIKFSDGTMQTTAATTSTGISAVTTGSCSVSYPNQTTCTVSCPTSYYRTGCSAGYAGSVSGAAYSQPSGNGCLCTTNETSCSMGLCQSETCYAICAK
jgi:hypothetical protein